MNARNPYKNSPSGSGTAPEIPTSALLKLAGIAILIFVAVVVLATGTYTVQPGNRGVEVTLGKVSPNFKAEGFGFKQPFVTRIEMISIRQHTQTMPAECYSSDLQQLKMEITVLYRIPEQSVVKIFQDYSGEPFDSLIAPRVLEAVKEVVATKSAELVVKHREDVKQQSLELARRKVGTNFIHLADLVVYNIKLTPELEHAIEQKMVQEQEAAKAKFTQLKTQIDAEIAVVRAKGEADAIGIRGTVLQANPDFLRLQIVQNWNGHSPLIVGDAGSGTGLMLTPEMIKSATAARTPARPGGETTPARAQTRRQ